MDKFHICITGAGVVGLSIAYQLSLRHNNAAIVLIDSEDSFGTITSSRNSEVIHAGIYYKHNSLKARLCVRGKLLLYEFLEKYKLPFKRIGKLIVAQKGEDDRLARLKETAAINGVNDLSYLTKQNLRKVEPALFANSALFSPSTGILDSHRYMQKLLTLAEENGVIFAPRTNLKQVHITAKGFKIETEIKEHSGDKPTSYEFICDKFINSAGLNAQNISKSIRELKTQRIPTLHPCKGDYFSYAGKNPFKHLIYPLPERNHTGLGIHSTTDVSGQLRFGPDTEYVDILDYSIDEFKRELFASSIRAYFPDVDKEKLSPAYSGIRPKINGLGEKAADFCIQGPESHNIDGLVQLFGMESPALTASLAIAEYVEELLAN